MKKKIFILLGFVLVLFLLAGCGEETVVESPGEVNEDGQLTDGTFTAASHANERGYVTAEVTIANDEITAVSLTEYDALAEAKGDDYGLDEWHEAMEELPGRFEESNSAEVDVVSGATSTSEKAMDAVAKALARSEGFTGTFDGTFMGASDVSERGGWGIALVTLEDGDIVEVSLKEVAEGEFKDEDYGYETWHEAADEMPERFVEANSPEVDVFTEATGSSQMWIQAVERALAKAGE